MTTPYAAPPARTPGETRARWVAAGVCALQALVLGGFCAFYLYELFTGTSGDGARVVTSVVLMAVFAGLLAALGHFWGRTDATWPTTPTIVGNLLLMPVAWGLLTGGQQLLGVAVGVVAVVGLGAAVLARPGADNPDGTDETD